MTSPAQRLPVRVENELLRVLQEGLSNVAKHARADTVEVTWAVVDGEGTLTIRDDGRGFDSAKGVRESAYGLVGMRERADMIGARINIESAPGLGTTVTVVAGRNGHGRTDDRWAEDLEDLQDDLVDDVRADLRAGRDGRGERGDGSGDAGSDDGLDLRDGSDRGNGRDRGKDNGGGVGPRIVSKDGVTAG